MRIKCFECLWCLVSCYQKLDLLDLSVWKITHILIPTWWVFHDFISVVYFVNLAYKAAPLPNKLICVCLQEMIICSGGIKGEKENLPPPPPRRLCPHLSPDRRKIEKKSAIFSNILDFCPLRNAFCPINAPTPQKISCAPLIIWQ